MGAGRLCDGDRRRRIAAAAASKRHQAQEETMADERDTDRLAGELLSSLMGFLTGPMAGTGRPQPRPQVDEGSMLNTIKEFLNQSLPGTKEKEQAGAAAPTPPAGGTKVEVEWEAMYRRQDQERVALYARQAREREAVLRRHVQAMEAAMGIRREPVEAVVRPTVRPAPAAQPVPAGPATGIVPGKTIGRWSVMTENGPKSFVAVSEEQAFREARRYGLTPVSARLTGLHTYTQEELEKAYRSFGVPGKRASQVEEFERAIKLGLIPETAEFVLMEDREWGYRVGAGSVLYKGSELIERLRR